MTELKLLAEIQAAKAQELPAFQTLNLIGLRSNVEEALTNFGKFSMFEEYTKHDMSHVDSMLAIYDWLVPDSAKSTMTPADWLLVTISTYLHDFGLLVTRDEFDQRHHSSFPAYSERIRTGTDGQFQDYRAQLSRMDSRDAELFLYQEFARENHAKRIRSWLSETPDPALGYDPALACRLRAILAGVEETFVEDLAIVAESHHLEDLGDTIKYPVNRPYGATPLEEANVQYAALLLRTADLLHITRDRVPAISAVVVNPRNPKSQTEWAKQSAVRTVRARTPVVDESGKTHVADTIEIHATFKEPEGYFGLTAYLLYAGAQIAQTHRWAEESLRGGAVGYEFPWRLIDTDQIKARGFVAEQFQFSLDQGKILDLLTGHTLYNDTNVVLRELMQNSLDATRLQTHSEVDFDYIPKIVVEWTSDDRSLVVMDNGTGMSQRTIEDFFLRVGSSRYRDPAFQKEFPNYSPISRFGIGVLSAFMVADNVTVVTSAPEEPLARHLDLRDVHGMYLIKLLPKESPDLPDFIRAHGTAVKIQLRPSARMKDVGGILENWIVVPGCEVLLIVDGGAPISIGSEDVAAALTRSLLETGVVQRDPDGKLVQSGSRVEVREYSSEGFDLAYAVVWSKWLQEWNFLVARDGLSYREPEPDMRFGTCVGGVRVTNVPPGFHLRGIAAIANAHGRGAPRTNVARSAIEDSDEYDAFLTSVYGAYLHHIELEMSDLELRRGSSISQAAREASFIIEILTGSPVVSQRLLQAQVESAKAIVVERSGSRTRKSLRELDELSELLTFESITISRLEAVLSSVRGAESASLATLLAAVGAESGAKTAANPVVSNLGSGGYFARAFQLHWEPSRISYDESNRELELNWVRTDRNQPRWRGPIGGLPPRELHTLVEVSSMRASSLSRFAFAVPDRVEVRGVEEHLVSSHGRTLVLPTSSINLVRASADLGDDSETLRYWVMAWLASSLTGHGRDYPDGTMRSDEASIMSLLNHSGAISFVDPESVRAAIAGFKANSLDVMRWDRKVDG